MIDILLTNDDGYSAIGFYPLLKKLSEKFNVIAVAPDSKKSWTGKSISYKQNLKVSTVKLNEFEIFTVNGTPADCVQIGLYDLAPNRPKLVVSGINIGLNAGHGRILSSGTAGAGMEAAIDGVKAVASSLHLTHDKDDQIDYFDPKFYWVYENPAKITTKIVEIVLQQPMEEDVDLISINIPFDANLNSPLSVTSVARDAYGKLFHKSAEGYSYSHPPLDLSGYPDGTDLHAIYTEKISLTPISLDLTSEKSKDKLATLFKKSW